MHKRFESQEWKVPQAILSLSVRFSTSILTPWAVFDWSHPLVRLHPLRTAINHTVEITEHRSSRVLKNSLGNLGVARSTSISTACDGTTRPQDGLFQQIRNRAGFPI